MATTLRTKLDKRIPTGDGDQVQLTFVADYNDGRNAEWAKYTPALSISFVVKSDASAADFEVGQAYTFTIDETPDDGSVEPSASTETAR